MSFNEKKKSTDGTTSVNAYNPSNKFVTRCFVEATLSKWCGYSVRINNLDKYQLAFIHKSVYRKNIAPPDDVVAEYLSKTSTSVVPSPPPIPIGTYRGPSVSVVFTDTYEASEWSGDGWIGAVVGQYIKNRFPNQSEGFYTKMKSHVVCKDGLSKISRHLGFGDYALLSCEAEQLLTRENPSLLEDMFEAFCDAIIEDQGVGMLRVVVKNLIESGVIDFRPAIINDSNYKDVLKRVCREQGWTHPKYIDLGDNGLMGAKREYSVAIEKIPESGLRPRTAYDMQNKPLECVALGSGSTKKKAQQAAALNALKLLESIKV